MGGGKGREGKKDTKTYSTYTSCYLITNSGRKQIASSGPEEEENKKKVERETGREKGGRGKKQIFSSFSGNHHIYIRNNHIPIAAFINP